MAYYKIREGVATLDQFILHVKRAWNKTDLTSEEHDLAEQAEKTDLKHADLIMKKRWKARGYGKWKQPEGTVWYFDPGTHKMVLVREAELNIIGY